MKTRYRTMIKTMEARDKTSAVPAGEAVWSLYILRCGDGSLYTGVTNDIDRRFRAHQDGRASRYTRTRRPVEIVFREECGSRSQALSRECAVKSMSRKGKDGLIAASAAKPALTE